jgi:hypothetical protein
MSRKSRKAGPIRERRVRLAESEAHFVEAFRRFMEEWDRSVGELERRVSMFDGNPLTDDDVEP